MPVFIPLILTRLPLKAIRIFNRGLANSLRGRAIRNEHPPRESSTSSSAPPLPLCWGWMVLYLQTRHKAEGPGWELPAPETEIISVIDLNVQGNRWLTKHSTGAEPLMNKREEIYTQGCKRSPWEINPLNLSAAIAGGRWPDLILLLHQPPWAWQSFETKASDLTICEHQQRSWTGTSVLRFFTGQVRSTLGYSTYSHQPGES